MFSNVVFAVIPDPQIFNRVFNETMTFLTQDNFFC
jgi:hypothetical protein